MQQRTQCVAGSATRLQQPWCFPITHTASARIHPVLPSGSPSLLHIFLAGPLLRTPLAVRCLAPLPLAFSSTAWVPAHTRWLRRLPGRATWICCSRHRSCTNQEASWPPHPCRCLHIMSFHLSSTLWGSLGGECTWQPRSLW